MTLDGLYAHCASRLFAQEGIGRRVLAHLTRLRIDLEEERVLAFRRRPQDAKHYATSFSNHL